MRIFPLLCVAVLLAVVPLGLRAAPGLLTNYTSLVDIGGHHRTWQVGDPTIPGGCHSILELESGMNRWDAASQTWVPAAVGIDLNADGSAFVSENTYCQVLIATNLNVMAAVSAAVSGPDGYNLRLLSTPLAIALYDPVSGSSLTIGVITNCAGAPVEGRLGELWFPDAFAGAGVCAGVHYTIEKGSVSQDVLFTGRLDPTTFGFSTNCWVQVISELYECPDPDIVRRPIYVERDQAVRQRMRSPDMIDEMLGFGEMVFGPGRAYGLAATPGAPDGVTAVAKQFQTTSGGRSFVVEGFSYAALQPQFMALPECTPGGQHARLGPPGGTHFDYASLPKPPARALAARSGQGKPAPGRHGRGGEALLASCRPAAWPTAGVVADYTMTLGSAISSSLSLPSSTNVLVAGTVNVNAALVLEPTVIKYKTNATLRVNSTLTLKNFGLYRGATFTAVDDDTIGDSMSTLTNAAYTGTINASGYANPAIYTAATSLSLTNCRFRYARIAVECNSLNTSSSTYTLAHSQFINCIQGVQLTCYSGSGSTGAGSVVVNLNNCLAAGVTYPFYASSLSVPATLTLANCTVDQASVLIGGGSSTTLYVQSTNGVYANVTNSFSPTAWSGADNGFYNCAQTFGGLQLSASASPFQSVGAGNYYLTDASGFRNAGTNYGVPVALQADLQKRTTYPPTVLCGLLLTNNQNLLLQVQRNTGGVDLGFHYDPIDWAVGWVLFTNATVTLGPGTVVAAFGTNGGSAGVGTYGLGIGAGAVLQSQGTATNPNWFVAYNTVQEQTTNGGWIRPSNSLVISEFGGYTPAPTVNCRFTFWSVPCFDEAAFNAPTNTGPFNFRDCEFHGGMLLSARPTLNLTNCLLERVYTDLRPGDTNVFWLRNCLFYGGLLTLAPTNTSTGAVYDNLLDKTGLTNWAGTLAGATNAYVTGYSNLAGPSNNLILSASPSYQVGPLGNYYVLTNSGLTNIGSTWASNVCLYHYTVTTNLVNGYEVKEGGTRVDLSYHYVATDGAGNPIDTDGDCVPDYLEDTNGDGYYNAGDLSDWTTYNSANGLTSGSSAGVQVFTPLKP